MAPRIVSSSSKKKRYTEATYRKAYPFLLKDTGDRCAYSMVHVMDAGGNLEIDHFNPRPGGNSRNHYHNLFPSIRLCNGRKSDEWPTKEQRNSGIHLINPRKELDYGEQIFEDLITGELVGTTDAAKYHIIVLDLNHKFLIKRRLERTKLRRLYNEWPFVSQVPHNDLIDDVEALRQLLDRAIPRIPPLPDGAARAATPQA